MKSLDKRAAVMILAGGQGSRLYPLTKYRAKPAVPFGGSYRIIDFTLSNCLNSGLTRIFLLTQYRSVTLHRHVQNCWSSYVTSRSRTVHRPGAAAAKNACHMVYGNGGRHLPKHRIS